MGPQSLRASAWTGLTRKLSNVIELAVAVVIGVAFGAIVTSLVENIITPIIGALGGQPDFSGLSFELNNSEIRYGAFLNSLIAFLIIAAASSSR